MLTISWDTVQSLLAGAATVAWAALAFVARWFHNRLCRMEAEKAGTAAVAKVSEEVAQIASDLEVVKRVLFLVAHKLDIPAEALNR